MTLATFSSHAQRKESCKYGTHDCLFVVTSLFCNFSLFLKGKFYWVSWSMYFWYVEGVRPGCWWSGYGSRGNNVPECHSCSCWKHCQVKLCVCVLFPHVTDGLHCSLKWISVSFLFSRTIDRSVFKPIVQISVIGRSESSDCHLLAVTHAGTGYKHRRLCLTCWTYSNALFLQVCVCTSPPRPLLFSTRSTLRCGLAFLLWSMSVCRLGFRPPPLCRNHQRSTRLFTAKVENPTLSCINDSTVNY